MILPVFDFARYINVNSQDHSHSNIVNRQTCDEFYDKLFSVAAEQIDAINHGSDFELFTAEEIQYLREKKTTLKNWQAVLTAKRNRKRRVSMNTGKIKQFQHIIEYKQEWSEWQKAQALTLTAELNKPVPSYEMFKTEWNRHQQLANYTHKAIYQIASFWLPNLISYYQSLTSLITWHTILRKKTAVDNAAQAYIIDLHKKATALQTVLAESMLARLIAYDESGFNESYPAAHLTCKLYEQGDTILAPLTPKMNALQKNYFQPLTHTIPVSPSRLQANEFNYFHQYIEKYGSTATKTKLCQLSWYRNRHYFPVKILTTSEGKMLVPEEMADIVPSRRYWPNWLFSERNEQFDHFKNETYLITHLQRRRNLAEHFVDLQLPQSHRYLIDELRSKDMIVAGAIVKNTEKIRKNSSLFSRLLNNSLGQFYCHWQNVLLKYRRCSLEDKIILSEMLVNSMECETATVEKIETLLPQTIHDLIWLVQELDVDKIDVETVIAMKTKMQNMQQQLKDIISLHKISQQLAQLSQGKHFTDVEIENLIKDIKYLEQNNKSLSPYLQKLKEKYLPIIQDHLLRCLRCAMHTTRGDHFLRERDGTMNPYLLQNVIGSVCSNANQERMLNFYTVISAVAPMAMLHTVEMSITKCMFWYLQQWLLAADDKQNITMIRNNHYSAITIIEKFGCACRWGDKTVLERITELEQLYEKNNILWKIKCKSVIMTLGQEYFSKRFLKEADQFSVMVNDIINTHLGMKHNGADMQLFQKAVCFLVAHEFSIERLQDKLSKSESTLLGIDGPEHNAIKDLLLACARVKKIQYQINDNLPNFVQQLQLVKGLSHSISQLLQAHPLTKNNASVQGIKSGKQPWFSKFYVAENLMGSASIQFVIPAVRV